MASSSFLVFLLFISTHSLSTHSLSKTHEEQKTHKDQKPFVTFPLHSLQKTHKLQEFPSVSSSLVSKSNKLRTPTTPRSHPHPPGGGRGGGGGGGGGPYKFGFKYTMALVLSLPIGTPPQTQPMVLDTGSQLSWVQCHNDNNNGNKKDPSSLMSPQKPPSFDPSLSSSFSLLPCNSPTCQPRNPDFTLPTSCDDKQLCHFSYFYADGTLAEGNLVREKIPLSNHETTPPFILGCSRDSRSTEGILGMNTGRLSFVSQARVRKFSYCVPPRRNLTSAASPPGTFLLGENPFSGGFRYAKLLSFSAEQQRLPNLDSAAYTVAMTGIRVGGKRLNISRSAFLPDSGGSGQTMVDSGTEFTYLVEDAYRKVKEEVSRLVGPVRVRRGYAYQGALDTCFQGDVAEIGRLLGDLVLEMEGGAELVTRGEQSLVRAAGGVTCLSLGSSQLLGVSSNIIGNFHQQNNWVEFDLLNRRVGFGRADCTKAL